MIYLVLAVVMVRWLIPDKVTLVGSATLYKSEYRADDKSDYIVSAWDNNFIVNLSAVYDLPHIPLMIWNYLQSRLFGMQAESLFMIIPVITRHASALIIRLT